MKTVKCSICGIVTHQFIRHKLVAFCHDCFFRMYNFCHKCGAIYPYNELTFFDEKDCISYYCKDCLEELFECSYCGKKIGLDDEMYFSDDIICRSCYNLFKNL